MNEFFSSLSLVSIQFSAEAMYPLMMYKVFQRLVLVESDKAAPFSDSFRLHIQSLIQSAFHLNDKIMAVVNSLFEKCLESCLCRFIYWREWISIKIVQKLGS